MGRLPDTFAQRKITFRQPYEMYGEKSVTSAQQNQQFSESTFLNATDKPFEIHRMIPRVVALDDSDVALSSQPDQSLLQSLVRLTIVDLGKNTPLTKSPTPPDSLTKGSSERTWEWAEPYYLVKSEQFQVTINVDTLPTDGDFADVESLQVRLTFEGFFLVIAPPS